MDFSGFSFQPLPHGRCRTVTRSAKLWNIGRGPRSGVSGDIFCRKMPEMAKNAGKNNDGI